MVTTRRPAVLLKHVVPLEVPIVAKTAEQPYWFWFWLRRWLRLWLWLGLWNGLWSGLWNLLWNWLWSWLWSWLWLLLRLWLYLRTLVHVIMIDRDMAVAKQASSLKSFKLEVANIMHGSFSRGVVLRIITSIRTGTIVDIRNVHRGLTRLR